MSTVYMSSVTYMVHRKYSRQKDCFKNHFASTVKCRNQIYTYVRTKFKPRLLANTEQNKKFT